MGLGDGASSEEEEAELTRGVMVNLLWPAVVSHCTGGQWKHQDGNVSYTLVR